MKRTPILLAATLLLAFFVTSCSDRFEEANEAAELQARGAVANTNLYHALIPGNSQNVYEAEVIEYTDGSVRVNRAVVPFDPNYSYVHSVLASNVPLNQSRQGTTVDFSSTDGWYVPFDPGAPAALITGRTIIVECECNTGNSGCHVDVLYDPSTQAIDISCRNEGCQGECIPVITEANQNYVGGGVMIATNNLIAP